MVGNFIFIFLYYLGFIRLTNSVSYGIIPYIKTEVQKKEFKMIDWSQSKDPRSTKKLIEDGMRIMQETIVIPNAWLPQDWHDNKRGGRTLARLNKMCDKQEGLTEHKKLKATKARNIEAYRQQFEQEGKFEYNQEVDEMKLYASQQAWCRFCPSIDLEN